MPEYNWKHEELNLMTYEDYQHKQAAREAEQEANAQRPPWQRLLRHPAIQALIGLLIAAAVGLALPNLSAEQQEQVTHVITDAAIAVGEELSVGVTVGEEIAAAAIAVGEDLVAHPTDAYVTPTEAS